MKYIALIFTLMGLCACQSMGKILQGGGQGLQAGANNNKQANCLTTGTVSGNTYNGYTSCH